MNRINTYSMRIQCEFNTNSIRRRIRIDTPHFDFRSPLDNRYKHTVNTQTTATTNTIKQQGNVQRSNHELPASLDIL